MYITTVRFLLTMLLAVCTADAQTLSSAVPPDADNASGSHVLTSVQASLRLSALQHAFRIGLEAKTRAELGGSFLGDYRRSLRLPRQWGDGDSWRTNYVGHPIQGAASGFIWTSNDPSAPSDFTLRRDYWTSRLRGMAWAAGYSVQFEVGPFSEASIGNVGLRPATVGWVDHVVTPTGGLALMIGEDAVDRFVIAKLERKVRSPALRGALRILLNPSRATANVASMRAPWHRPGRPVR